MKCDQVYLVFLVLIILDTSPLATRAQDDPEEIPEANQTEQAEAPAEEWEYEPRLWSIDDSVEPVPSDQLHDDHGEAQEMDDPSAPMEQPVDMPNPHRLHHFMGSKPARDLNRQVYVNTTCDQFRVDIREAVVCDRKRCDKLEFEWPKHDNQLTLIETTKHGMRFHRVDLAFAPRSRLQEVNSKPSAPGGRQNQTGADSRVKLDLFELFKPKPTTPGEPPTTQGPQPSSSTKPEGSSGPPPTTTIEPNTPTETPPTTAALTPEPDDPQLRDQDTNSTQLVSTFRLDTRRRKQQIVGFGGALSDSTCKNIKSLSPEMAKSLMEDYYGDRGLRYNMVRISVGSSDFSTSPYTNNDRVAGNNNAGRRQSDGAANLTQLPDDDDLEMKNFRLTEEDYLLKLPVVRQAIATSKQQLKIFGSLWSPPTWMKNNSHIVHGFLKGDVYGPYYKALAELMIKWLEAYRKNGIEMWGFTGLNEPVTGVKPFIFHNSLGITRDDYITFFKLYLGPMMRQRGFPKVNLMIVDDNRGYMPNWARTLLQDQEAAKYISGVASHWYMNDEYENLDFISRHYPDKFILATEACNGYLPFQVHTLPGDWDRGVAYMYDLTKMMQKNAVGWVDWNMVLDLSGGPSWIKNFVDAAVIVNARRDEYYKSPMFYAMGHFSRFVEPNSTRLDSRLANAKFDYPLEAVAFHTPSNYITIVVLNANKHPVPFRIIVDRQLVRVVTLRADSFNTIVFKWRRDHPHRVQE